MEALPTAAGVYAIVNIVTNERYIGATTDIAKRWRLHCLQLRTGKAGFPKLQEAWSIYGESAFRPMVLELVPEYAMLGVRETEYIQSLKPEYNVKQRSNHPPQYRKKSLTLEQIEHMRLAHANVSEETRAKMRKAKMGKAPMAATYAAAEKNRGKHRDHETIERIKKSQRLRWERKREELLANTTRDERTGRFSQN